jgi:hypothetical protein
VDQIILSSIRHKLKLPIHRNHHVEQASPPRLPIKTETTPIKVKASPSRIYRLTDEQLNLHSSTSPPSPTPVELALSILNGTTTVESPQLQQLQPSQILVYYPERTSSRSPSPVPPPPRSSSLAEFPASSGWDKDDDTDDVNNDRSEKGEDDVEVMEEEQHNLEDGTQVIVVDIPESVKNQDEDVDMEGEERMVIDDATMMIDEELEERETEEEEGERLLLAEGERLEAFRLEEEVLRVEQEESAGRLKRQEADRALLSEGERLRIIRIDEERIRIEEEQRVEILRRDEEESARVIELKMAEEAEGIRLDKERRFVEEDRIRLEVEETMGKDKKRVIMMEKFEELKVSRQTMLTGTVMAQGGSSIVS